MNKTTIGLQEISLAAAHMVHTVDTKCYRLHGHNWIVNVELIGDIADDGMIVDYGLIKEYLDMFDHKVWFIEGYTDDVKYEAYREMCVQYGDAMQIAVPVITSEHMANFFAKEIKEKFGLKGVQVTVFEGLRSYATGVCYDEDI